MEDDKNMKKSVCMDTAMEKTLPEEIEMKLSISKNSPCYIDNSRV